VQRTTCRCRDCGQRTTPRSLPAPYERAKVTCAWLAWLVDQKFAMLTPLDRLRRDLAARGVAIAMGSLVNFIERAADLLAPIDGITGARCSPGTGWPPTAPASRCSSPKLPAAHNGYLELYRNREVAVFQYEPTRPPTPSSPSSSRSAARSPPTPSIASTRSTRPPRRRGRLQRARPPQVPRRRGHAARARRRGRRVHRRDVRRRAGRPGPASSGKAPRRIAAPIRRSPSASALARRVEPTLLPSEPLAAAVGYYQRHGAALFRFLDDPDVPIDNSPTEREFQTVAKLRLNMLFAGSTEGAHRACVLLGIVATCRAIGVPVQAYLTWAFERLGTHRDVFALPVEQLTPAAFKRTPRWNKSVIVLRAIGMPRRSNCFSIR
jgi:hypothetical protein